nr:asparagine synthase (glutamine-hydrolyzing) [Flavisolibacter sp.]
MCGIAGGFVFKEAGKRYTSKIREAISCINHRGPDGDGVFVDETVSLGHKRLSIIDTSVGANQPMWSRDKQYCIIFNGEIFNYKELKATYLKDHHFSTSSDTEVFLQLYIKKGVSCFSELRGFFAAAIYNSLNNELVVVRDRLGKKPVHLFQNEDVLLFASELKSLLSFGIPRDINWDVLPFYFQLNYIPQPLSILRGVRKLVPGNYLKISKDGLEEKSYYELAIRRNAYKEFSYEEAQKKLVNLLDDATKLRLISDVPLGAFLSGGIDSSVVVAMAARHQQQLQTFSIGYKDNPFFDETYYANLVAKKYKTDHHVFALSNTDFLEHVDDVLNHIDEPFADSSSIPTYILSKLTRKHVTVALSGDGGDEVFAGYNKYNAEWNVMQPSIKKNVVKGLAPLWQVLPKSRSNKLSNKFRQLHRFAKGASLQAEERYWQWASMMPAEDSQSLFSKDKKLLFNNQKLQEIFNWGITGNDLNEVLMADMNLVLAGDML